MMSPKQITSWQRYAYLLLWCILTAILIVACNGTNNLGSSKQLREDCRVVQHIMGETCIPLNPQRVITLHPNPLANSLALGIEPIASAFYANVPVLEIIQKKVDRLESVGDLSEPNIEKILLLEPDLILSYSGLESLYPQLDRIAPTVVLDLPFPPPSWKEQLEELAQILDKQETYQQLMADYWQRIENLKQAFNERSQDLNISVAGLASGRGMWTYGTKHPVAEILNDLGVQRPTIQKGDYYFLENISEEKLSDIDGDILFLTTWDREKDREMTKQLKQKPLWQKLKAVREKQIYVVDRYWHNAGHILSVNAILDDLEQYLINSTTNL